ncbi:MAG: tetratricopeptide repeat protein [Micropepsaceae bacterium]
MLTRLFSAFIALSMIASFTLPASAIEDAAARRERQAREAQNYPSMALDALNKKDADLAIQLYTKAIDSGAFRDQPETLGQLFYGRGLAFRMKKDCTAAVADFDKAANYINKGDLFFSRAACHLDMNQEDAALVDLDLAIKADPAAPMYRSARCIMLFNRKDFAGALPDCEKALEAAPADKNILMAASQAAEQSGNRPRAAELYRKLLAIDPGNPVATEGLKRVAG